jgi:molybdopterin synthase sulfur carrier subunit
VAIRIADEPSVKVLFFAEFRERLSTDQMIWTLNQEGLSTCSDQTVHYTVSQLRSALCAEGRVWRDCLDQHHCFVAVNQALACWDTPLSPGDEVAFYPPVTGG